MSCTEEGMWTNLDAACRRTLFIACIFNFLFSFIHRFSQKKITTWSFCIFVMQRWRNPRHRQNRYCRHFGVVKSWQAAVYCCPRTPCIERAGWFDDSSIWLCTSMIKPLYCYRRENCFGYVIAVTVKPFSPISKIRLDSKIKKWITWHWLCPLRLVCHLKASSWYNLPVQQILRLQLQAFQRYD